MAQSFRPQASRQLVHLWQQLESARQLVVVPVGGDQDDVGWNRVAGQRPQGGPRRGLSVLEADQAPLEPRRPSLEERLRVLSQLLLVGDSSEAERNVSSDASSAVAKRTPLVRLAGHRPDGDDVDEQENEREDQRRAAGRSPCLPAAGRPRCRRRSATPPGSGRPHPRSRSRRRAIPAPRPRAGRPSPLSCRSIGRRFASRANPATRGPRATNNRVGEASCRLSRRRGALAPVTRPPTRTIAPKTCTSSGKFLVRPDCGETLMPPASRSCRG